MTYPQSRYKLISLVLLVSTMGACEEKPKSSEVQAPKAQRAPATSNSSGRTPKNEPDCPDGIRPRILGRVQSSRLREISGLVASRTSSNLLWVHNDSGDEARIYAMSLAGAPIGEVELPRVAHDWEDIALEHRQDAPDRIYVTDTGDNLGDREDGAFIHRFEEPTLKALRTAHPKPLHASDTETMKVRFPDGPVDAEALIVDSKSGELILISKPRLAPPEIYGVDAFSEEATVKHLGTITLEADGRPLHLVTAADLSADGRHVVLRTYDTIVVFHRKKGQSVASALLAKGCSIKPAHENQGEAVGFLSASGVASETERSFPHFITVGEGAAQPIYAYE